MSVTEIAALALATAATSPINAWHIESSCIGRKYFVEKLPRIGSIDFGDFLNRVADVYQNVVAGLDTFLLQQEKTYFTFDTTCFAGALEAVDRFDFHGDGKTHVAPCMRRSSRCEKCFAS
jgi:hypothetical protein